MAAIQLRFSALHLLGHGAVQHCRAVHFADGRMDARLYRPLFLATVEIILRLGGASAAFRCSADAGARNDRRASWRTRSGPTRRGFGNGETKI